MPDREKVIKKLQDALEDAEEDGKIYAEIRRPVVFDAIELLKEQEVKTGKWIERTSDIPHVLWECSECGEIIYSESEADRKRGHKYCGQCGSLMI